jgi:mono/diheme cytochrome c family protein
MPGRRRTAGIFAGVALVIAGTALALPTTRFYWRIKSANPVRRGVRLARGLGCFACHGELGARGLPDPSPGQAVPTWSGGTWMMYVNGEDEIRQFILDGVSERRSSAPPTTAAIRMPAYAPFVDDREADDLTAAFLVLSGMKRPDAGTLEARGLDIARERHCLACHGAAGSGGLPNPGSFTGFVPGWYGADFRDLVRDRGEFDDWVRRGTISRLTGNLIAARFLERARLSMPPYADLADADLDALWAYTRWLAQTEGGLKARTQEF